MRIKDNAEDRRLEVQGKTSLENHPHLSSVEKKYMSKSDKMVYQQYLQCYFNSNLGYLPFLHMF